MKKIIALYLIFSLLLLPSVPVMATNIPTAVKIKKENDKYCLYEKSTNKILIPCEYDEMKKLTKEAVKVKKGNKFGILYNNGEIAIPVIYDFVTSKNEKDKNGQKLFQYYGIDKANKIVESKVTEGVSQNIIDADKNFINYPSANYVAEASALLWKPIHKNVYNLVYVKGNNDFITYVDAVKLSDGKAWYQPDNKSLSHLSYFDSAIILKRNNKWGVISPDGKIIVRFEYDKIITFDAYIDEEVIPISDNVNDNQNVKIKYNEISFPEKDKFIAFKGNKINIIDITGKTLYSGQKPQTFLRLNSPNLISDIISLNNINSIIKFYNYLQNGVISYKENGKYGLIIVNNGKNTKLDAKYDGFIFPDENTVLFNLFGISFANLKDIFAVQNSKKFPIETIERYNTEPNHYWYAIKPSAKIKETITFDNFGANIRYDSIIMPNINYEKDMRNSLSSKPYSHHMEKHVAVDIADNNDAVSRLYGCSTSASNKEKLKYIITAPLWVPMLILVFPLVWWAFREG